MHARKKSNALLKILRHNFQKLKEINIPYLIDPEFAAVSVLLAVALCPPFRWKKLEKFAETQNAASY